MTRVEEAMHAAELANMELFEAELHVSRVLCMVEKSGFQVPPPMPIWEHLVLESKGGKYKILLFIVKLILTPTVNRSVSIPGHGRLQIVLD